MQVDWEGPDNRNDFIALYPVGESNYVSYTYTAKGKPLSLQLPAQPGAYELAYVLAQKRTVIARIPVTVEPVTASVSPPADLPAGGTVAVTWQGPDDKNDFIAIFPKGSDTYSSYVYTRTGSPANLVLPASPGDYDLAYVQSVGRTVIARVPVTVTAVSASITPPSDLPAGSTVPVVWDGPDDKNDFIAIFPKGSDTYSSYV